MGDPASAWSFLVWIEKKKSFDQQIKKAQKRPLFFFFFFFFKLFLVSLFFFSLVGKLFPDRKKRFDQQIKKALHGSFFFFFFFFLNSSLWLSFVSPWGGNCSPTEKNNDLYFSLLRNVWVISEPLLLDPPFSPSLSRAPLVLWSHRAPLLCSIADE